MLLVQLKHFAKRNPLFCIAAPSSDTYQDILSTGQSTARTECTVLSTGSVISDQCQFFHRINCVCTLTKNSTETSFQGSPGLSNPAWQWRNKKSELSSIQNTNQYYRVQTEYPFSHSTQILFHYTLSIDFIFIYHLSQILNRERNKILKHT